MGKSYSSVNSRLLITDKGNDVGFGCISTLLLYLKYKWILAFMEARHIGICGRNGIFTFKTKCLISERIEDGITRNENKIYISMLPFHRIYVLFRIQTIFG